MSQKPQQMDFSSIRKILVIKLRAIGDVVMSTIVIENLRRTFPQAQLSFLTEAPCKDVVLGNPNLHHVLVLDRKAKAQIGALARLQADWKFLQAVRHQQFDLVFDFFGNPRSALITWLSGAPWRVGYDYRIRQWAYNVVVPSRANELHEAEWHLDALRHLGIATESRHLMVTVDTVHRGFAKSFWRNAGLTSRPVVALNFSGGWPAKRWPIDRFAALATTLIEKYNVNILIIWGPGEQAEALRLAETCRHTVTLIPKTNLKELAAILEKVQLLISTDSGPMHIAAAMGVPCVAIFGPTNYRLQGPYGAGHEIVVKQGLDCLGCNRLDCDHTSCMQLLTVEDVMAAVERTLSRLRIHPINR